MLDINSKKTKIIIFQKRAKKTSDLEFHIGKQTIDIVHVFTYLGNPLNRQEFPSAVEYLVCVLV